MPLPRARRYDIVDGFVGRLPLLVIEDDALQRRLITRAAERCHYSVTQAKSCREGLSRLVSESFVCVTLDLKLADGDGVDVLQAMADLNYAGSVIVISGVDSAQRNAARQAARACGIVPSHSLPKPIDLAALRIALARLRCELLGLPMVQDWGQARGSVVERFAG